MKFEYEAINICIMLIMKIKYYVTEYSEVFIFCSNNLSVEITYLLNKIVLFFLGNMRP